MNFPHLMKLEAGEDLSEGYKKPRGAPGACPDRYRPSLSCSSGHRILDRSLVNPKDIHRDL